jgi:RNA-binding motif X-linked protein 2
LQASWHQKYLQSAWVYIGNLDLSLTEGDVLCVMSQCGEIDDINMAREENTGKSKGFCFLKYEDARSCVLAVDNLGGSNVCGRSLRVDHVEKYRLPKHLQEKEDTAQIPAGPGHAYTGKELENEFSLQQGQDLFAPVETRTEGEGVDSKLQRKEERRRQREENQAKKRDKTQRKADREERRRRKRAERSDTCSPHKKHRA